MRFFYLFILGLLFISCEEPFEYHPNEIRLDADERELTAKALAQLAKQTPGDTIRVVLMGDSQRFYDEVEEFTRHVSALHKKRPIDLVLHSGDITDFGLTNEFRWVNDIMRHLPMPYLTAIGNHDLLANGGEVYERMYGPKNYQFDYGFLRFLIIDTNSREYNFSGQVPNLSWLQANLLPSPRPTVGKAPEDAAQLSQQIVVSHVPPFSSDFDPKLEESFTHLLADNHLTQLSLHGHQHNWSEEEHYDDGVNYLVAGSQQKRHYALISLWREGYRIEQITF